VAELRYDSGRKEREGRFAHGMGRKREREVVALSIRAKICGGKVLRTTTLPNCTCGQT
jgi:hypothetical protein